MRSISIRRVGLFIISLLVSAIPGQAQDDPNALLMRIRARVAADISHLPNYLCTETVARQVLELDRPRHKGAEPSCSDLEAATNARLLSSDRLRVDVALTKQSEMFSWVGEGRFDDRSLSEIVRQGTTSTGTFGSFLRAIFLEYGAAYTYKGKSRRNDRTIFTYGFVMPIEHSGYTVSTDTQRRLTGYSGTFEVDSTTLDLLRLEITTDPLPPELHVCKSSTAVVYEKVPLNGVDTFLPSAVETLMVGMDARESRNRTVFSGCHQFLGESKLIFDDTSAENEAASPAAAKTKIVRVRAGLKMVIALTQPIDPATAAAGDPVRGKLTRAVKDSESGLLIPKGTVVNGRILGLTLIHTDWTDLELGLKWNSLEWDGVSQQLQLAVEGAIVGSATTALNRHRFHEIESKERWGQPGVGFFLFPSVERDYTIPAGFAAEWVTAGSARK